MTVNTTKITSGPYIGNDIADQFSYTFKVDDKTQLSVYETTDVGVETLLTVDTDYTVAGIGNDGGGILTRIVGALPTDYQWYIRSNYKETQLTSFSSQGAFFPELHENAMDKLTFLIQQYIDRQNRSLRVSDTYIGSLPLSIEDPAAGMLMRWKADLSGVENIEVSELDPSLSSSDRVVFNFASMAEAIASTDDTVIKLGGVLLIKDRASTVWDVVLTSSINPNDADNEQSTGLPTLSFVLRNADALTSISAVAEIAGLPALFGARVRWDGYFIASDGGGNWGIIKSGAHVEDKGRIFSISPNVYVEANIKPSISTNSKKFGLVGDGVTDDTVQAQRWRDMGGKLTGMRGETYLITGEMGLLDYCHLNLNGSTWDFQTTDNVRNFTMGIKSKLTNGTIYANHIPNAISTTTGGRAVGVFGFSDDTVNDPNNIWGWEISKLKIFGGVGYGNGEVRGIHPILMLGDVSEGVITNISIDGRQLTNLGVHAEWRASENFVDDPLVKIKLPRNIKVSNIVFRNGDTATDEGFVVGCSGAYNMKFSRIDARDCYTVAILSMGEAGPGYCQDDDALLINTNNVVEQVEAVNVRGYAAQCFGKANIANPGTDNIPRGDATFDNFKVHGDIGGASNIDGVFASGMARVNIKNNSHITGFPRYGCYPFNGTVELNVDESTVANNGLQGIYYIGNSSDSQLVQGSVTHNYIHSNGKLATIDNDKVGVGVFYAENVKVLFNRFGSGQGSTEGATQLFCVRGLSSVSPKRIQIVGNYKDITDTGVTHTWWTSRAEGVANNETYKILVHNNMLEGTLIEGTFTRTTDSYS